MQRIFEKIRKNKEQGILAALSLHRDLVTDTAIFNRNTERLKICTKKIDTLVGILFCNPQKKLQKMVFSIYILFKCICIYFSCISTPTESTLQQLKSSGALRYLGDTSLIRKIMNYEESVQIIYLAQNRFEPQKIENWSLVQKVFDQSYFNSLDSLSDFAINLTVNDERAMRFMNNNYPLLNYDKDLWQQLRNWAYMFFQKLPGRNSNT